MKNEFRPILISCSQNKKSSRANTCKVHVCLLGVGAEGSASPVAVGAGPQPLKGLGGQALPTPAAALQAGAYLLISPEAVSPWGARGLTRK